MSDPKCAGVMLRAVERDVLTLRDMSEGVPDESFGFHVQQPTEKALKALLALLGRKHPLTHNLYDHSTHADTCSTRGRMAGRFVQLSPRSALACSVPDVVPK